MASQLKVDTLTGVTTAGSIVVTGEGNSTTTNLQQGLAKAWANIDGDASTAATRDSFNVASITDAGTGQYDCFYTNNMSNDDYSFVCSQKMATPASDAYAQNQETTKFFINSALPGTDNYDTDVANAVIFGDLA
jgi:hypothetical protein